MRAKPVNEVIDFKRGQSSKKAMEVGLEGTAKMAESVKKELGNMGFLHLDIEAKGHPDNKSWGIIIPPPKNISHSYNHILRSWEIGGWTLSYGGSTVTAGKVDLDTALAELFDNYDALLDKSILDAERVKNYSMKLRNNIKSKLGKAS